MRIRPVKPLGESRYAREVIVGGFPKDELSETRYVQPIPPTGLPVPDQKKHADKAVWVGVWGAVLPVERNPDSRLDLRV